LNQRQEEQRGINNTITKKRETMSQKWRKNRLFFLEREKVKNRPLNYYKKAPVKGHTKKERKIPIMQGAQHNHRKIRKNKTGATKKRTAIISGGGGEERGRKEKHFR